MILTNGEQNRFVRLVLRGHSLAEAVRVLGYDLQLLPEVDAVQLRRGWDYIVREADLRAARLDAGWRWERPKRTDRRRGPFLLRRPAIRRRR